MQKTRLPAARTKLIAAALVAFAGTAQAQSITPAQFIQACRDSPGNTVVLTQPTKFQSASAGTTFATATPCTVVLAPGASFELDTITMTFGGRFTLQGGDGAKVSLHRATLRAPSAALNLTGNGNRFLMNEARLFTTGGALALQFGDKGFFEVQDSGAWYQPRLAAARGVLSITAGAYFSGNVVKSGLQGARGISVTFNGFDSSLKLENSDLLVSSGSPGGGTYTVGPLAITSAASKVSVEAHGVNLMEAGDNVTIALGGAESKVSLIGVTSATASKRVRITALGDKGDVFIERPLVYGSPEVIVESGIQGSTTVVNAPGSLAATDLIRIRSGGSCNATTQGLSAPRLQVCR